MPKDIHTPATILPYDATLYQICQEEGIKLEFFCTNWVRKLTKDDKVKYINGHKFDLNSYAAGEVADDKCATYEILSSRNIPAIEHALLYDFNNQAEYTLGRNSLPYVERYFAQHDSHIVIKPARGYCGIGVSQITGREQILPTLVELFHGSPTLAMCPFCEIRHEHRVILLDGEVRIAYRKSLAQQGQWKFNLACGAETGEIPEDLYKNIAELAKRAARTIGLRFCSVDIAELAGGELKVLEVNCGVMTSKFLRQHPEKYPEIRAMYRDAVRKMFEE